MKVSDLTGPQSDYWVAKAEGGNPRIVDGQVAVSWPSRAEFPYRPSTNWLSGGPIIERERIASYRAYDPEGWWVAGYNLRLDDGRPTCDSDWGSEPAVELDHSDIGATLLVAAMRSFVTSKYGKDVPAAATATSA